MRNVPGALIAILCAFATAPAGAEEDFTFKRIKVSDTKPGKLITVQIDPAEQARRLAALPKVDPNPDHSTDDAKPEADAETKPPPAVPASSYAWYWDAVPPGIKDVDGRYDLAMSSLSQGPGGTIVPAPRMQHMQDMAQAYGTDILKATIGTNVSPALVLAVIGIESAGKSDAVSTAGAVGLMQLIPDTAARFGVEDSTDPTANIKGGVAYLDWLLKEFDNDPVMVLAAYNSGEGAVKANAGVPPYAETRDYVPKVLAAWQVAQGLCLSPPQLVTDPCVFKVISSGG